MEPVKQIIRRNAPPTMFMWYRVAKISAIMVVVAPMSVVALTADLIATGGAMAVAMMVSLYATTKYSKQHKTMLSNVWLNETKQSFNRVAGKNDL